MHVARSLASLDSRFLIAQRNNLYSGASFAGEISPTNNAANFYTDFAVNLEICQTQLRLRTDV